MEALHTLGFQEYVEDVQAVHKEYREQASVSHMTRGRGLCESHDWEGVSMSHLTRRYGGGGGGGGGGF